jgi:hypothetical protein
MPAEHARSLRAVGRAGVIAALALISGCQQQVAAQQNPCGQPAAWPEPAAKPGQPERELAACLQQQAYETRNLAVPLQSAAAGIVAQCEIRVDQFEGGPIPSRDAGAEQAIMAQATAAVVQYRQCASR